MTITSKVPTVVGGLVLLAVKVKLSNALTPIGPVECGMGFAALDFSVFNFPRYPEYFHDESTITLAQAGTYQGPNDIEEYVSFASPFSPYVSAMTQGSTEESLVTIDGEVCVFSRMSEIMYEFNQGVVGNQPPVNVSTLSHIYYNVATGFIEEWNVYYEIPWLAYFFDDVLSKSESKVDDLICGTMSETCQLDVDASGPCQQKLNSLPLFTQGSYVDGNSKGCRLLHGVFAAMNPVNHCPHISFDAVPDPKGRIKCQVSKAVDPMDLFSADEIAGFRDFTDRLGYDHGAGYRVIETEEGIVSTLSGYGVQHLSNHEKYGMNNHDDDAKYSSKSNSSSSVSAKSGKHGKGSYGISKSGKNGKSSHGNSRVTRARRV